MNLKIIIALFFSTLPWFVNAQFQHCATKMGAEQLKELKQFQQKLQNGTVGFKKNGMQYIPVKIHFVGTNKGIGYYGISSLLQALCDINQDYIPTGFQFYLGDSIDYINDDDLYMGSSDAIWNYAGNYKKEGMVNIFFHGTGMQWCGVYFPGVDVVFIKHSCQTKNATTLTHELGHFFSLPHTFYGWESGNTPADIELIDGSNCRTSADGFCDTKADYISERWTCPFARDLIDPKGVHFKPDSSIYMSYSYDECQSRFSQEQMAAMRNNLEGRGFAKNNADVQLYNPPHHISPVNNDSNQNALAVTLKWNAVPGAFAYYLQVARMGAWEYLNLHKHH